MVATATVSLALIGCGGGSTPDLAEQEAGSDVVIHRYCAYGAVNKKQLAGCEEHVSLGDISGLNTNAADFALYKLSNCLADAGPFCTRVAK